MRAALDDAKIEPGRIDYINAHGTGTPANDSTETAAIHSVFRDSKNPLVSSTKSMHGHTLGSAGAIEAVATVLAIQRGLVPPTANFTQSDPACDLDVVPNTARSREIEYAMSNSFAFGGLNAVVVFRNYS
jgi:nodulation protein E